MKLLRGIAHAVLRAAQALAGFVLVYAVIAVLLGLLPVNRRFMPPAEGIEIFLLSNGVHAGFAVPLVSAEADLRGEFPPPPGTGDASAIFVTVGWGDRLVYTETPSWRELRPWSALTALLGLNPTVMHVEHIRRPSQNASVVPVRLTAAGYRRLIGHIRASVRRDVADRPVRLAGLSHGRQDAFYEGAGRYTLIYTCNEWVREGLAKAGVRTATWAPLDAALFYQLRR